MKIEIDSVLRNRFRWLVLPLLLLASACQQFDYSYFPDYSVSLTFNTTLPPYNRLAASGSVMDVRNPQLASDRLGLGGLILVHDYNAEFYAFDMACPVELLSTVKVSSKVEVSEFPMTATCPKCGSVYNLSVGSGYPLSGKAVEMKRHLKPYRVINVGNSEYRVSK